MSVSFSLTVSVYLWFCPSASLYLSVPVWLCSCLLSMFAYVPLSLSLSPYRYRLIIFVYSEQKQGWHTASHLQTCLFRSICLFLICHYIRLSVSICNCLSAFICLRLAGCNSLYLCLCLCLSISLCLSVLLCLSLSLSPSSYIYISLCFHVSVSLVTSEWCGITTKSIERCSLGLISAKSISTIDTRTSHNIHYNKYRVC